MSTFTATTWNVENLFRPAADAAPEDQTRYQEKLTLLARVIGQLDSEVIGFQEIGGEVPLMDLQAQLAGRYPHRAVSGFPDGRGIRVGFLSKLAITETEDIVGFPPGPALTIHELDGDANTVPVQRMGRGALRIRIGGDDWRRCHHRSP